MNPLNELHKLGQSIWLDDISREMLRKGTIRDYIDNFSLTGLTSNPTIFAKAVQHGTDYDEEVQSGAIENETDEEIFFRLAISDLSEAADQFGPVHQSTNGLDGWVSLELSPLLASDTRRSVQAAIALHKRAGKKNLFIKIPGTRAGLPAIEDAVFAGVPVNVTLLFSAKQYRAAAEAWIKGIERRVMAGLDPNIHSVASIFVSRWDVATHDAVAPEIRNKVGIAVARQAYRAYRELAESPRWERAKQNGVRPQRLLFASTSTKDPICPDTMYVSALAAPGTINTMPEKTLLAFAEHGKVDGTIPEDGADSGKVLEVARRNVALDLLAKRLQEEGTKSFDDSWNELLACIAAKAGVIRPSQKKEASR